MNFQNIIFSQIGLCLLFIAQANSWTYTGDEGVDFWADNYEACGGQKQSPIDINTDDAYYDESLDSFSFSNYYKTAGVDMTITNNGHSVRLDYSGTSMSVSGGGLTGRYVFDHLHFHWGGDDYSGSEHLFDGEQYPMEVHLVHYSSRYDNIGEAVDQDEGLAVLGFMFKVSGNNNPALTNLLAGFPDVLYKDNTTEVGTFAVDSLFSDAISPFYRYSGSLTTPGCYESVVWTVFEDAIPISSNQLAQFRQVFDEDRSPMIDNYRPVQPQNTRVVTYSMAPTVVMSLTTLFVSLLVAFSC